MKPYPNNKNEVLTTLSRKIDYAPEDRLRALSFLGYSTFRENLCFSIRNMGYSRYLFFVLNLPVKLRYPVQA